MADMRRLPDGEWINMDNVHDARVTQSSNGKTRLFVSLVGDQGEASYDLEFNTIRDATKWLDEFMKGEK